MNYTIMLFEDEKTQKASHTFQKRIDLGSAPDFVTHKNELYELAEEEAANLKYIKKNGRSCVALP